MSKFVALFHEPANALTAGGPSYTRTPTKRDGSTWPALGFRLCPSTCPVAVPGTPAFTQKALAQSSQPLASDPALQTY
jgi:hypothetical protein